jgi:hypothetical protein
LEADVVNREREGTDIRGAKSGEKPTARRPYAAPTLRYLGSVREITLGGSKVGLETGGTRSHPG